MTEQLQNKASDILVNMIDITVKNMSDIVNFSKQQIPDVIHQLLMWRALDSILSSVIPFIIGFSLLIWTMTFWRKVPKQASRDNDGRAPWLPDEYRSSDSSLYFKYWLRGYISFVIGSGAILVGFFSFNLDWLQIWIAPKVYLIQYAADLIKGVH